MSFDGVVHYSGGVAENHVSRSANQRAVPSVFSGLLNEALVYLREHAQALALRSFSGFTFTDASPHYLTTVREAWLPPHATALVVVINSGVNTVNPTTTTGYPIHRVRLVGGTGNIDSALVQGPSSATVGLPPGKLTYFTPLPLTTVVYLPLTDAALVAITADRTELTIELWGHALLEDGGGATEYEGLSASFYWLSEY
jgi:hypothetical protein